MSKFVARDCTVVSSAPGKVIIFGEHAVVHKVTAIAAALSDLRLFVKIELINALNEKNEHDFVPRLEVTFEDFRGDDNNATVVDVLLSSIKSAITDMNEGCCCH